jgi:hypothetical protein
MPPHRRRRPVRLAIGGHGKNVTMRLAAKYTRRDQHRPAGGCPAGRRSWPTAATTGRDPALGIVTGTNPAWPYLGLRAVSRQRHGEGGPAGDHALRLRQPPAAPDEMAQWVSSASQHHLRGSGLVDTDEGIYEGRSTTSTRPAWGCRRRRGERVAMKTDWSRQGLLQRVRGLGTGRAWARVGTYRASRLAFRSSGPPTSGRASQSPSTSARSAACSIRPSARRVATTPRC